MLSPRITEERTSFEWAIMKWVFIPVFTVLFLWALIGITIERNKCSNICEEKGFYTISYKPANRLGPSSCYCISKEEYFESKSKNRLAKGVQIF
jgi:hypothetical protein